MTRDTRIHIHDLALHRTWLSATYLCKFMAEDPSKQNRSAQVRGKALKFMMEMVSSLAGSGLALLFFVGAYFFAVWDSRRPDAEEDGQIGLKIVLYTLALGALGVAAGGIETLVLYLVSGTKTGTPAIKSGLAGLVSGAVILAGITLAMLPRTNTQQHPKVFRLALGTVAALAGTVCIVAFAGFVNMMINGGGKAWVEKAAPFATCITYGGLAFLSLSKLGNLSGWVSQPRPMAPQAGVPQQQGYPPQQSGGVPQQQGYPPQQQGYPPQQQQQQGYPPQQQGGYPPQGGGGGYPPQGGGAGGGGYQPR